MKISGIIVMALGMLLAVAGVILGLFSARQDGYSYAWIVDHFQVNLGMGIMLTGALVFTGGAALFEKPVRVTLK